MPVKPPVMITIPSDLTPMNSICLKRYPGLKGLRKVQYVTSINMNQTLPNSEAAYIIGLTSVPTNPSDILPRHSPGYGTQDLVRYGAGVSRYLVRSNRVIAIAAQQDGLITRFHLRQISSIHQEPVHADAADDRAAPAAQQNCTLVGQRTGNAIRITCSNVGDFCLPRGNERSAVAEGRLCREELHVCHSRRQFHNRPHLYFVGQPGVRV